MTRDEIDIMWQQAMQESVEAGEMFTRYHFAELVTQKAFNDGYEKGVAGFMQAVGLEREECAKILDANAMACESPIWRSLLQSNAQAIRVRGQA